MFFYNFKYVVNVFTDDSACSVYSCSKFTFVVTFCIMSLTSVQNSHVVQYPGRVNLVHKIAHAFSICLNFQSLLYIIHCKIVNSIMEKYSTIHVQKIIKLRCNVCLGMIWYFQQLNLPANTDTFSFPSEDIIQNCNKLHHLIQILKSQCLQKISWIRKLAYMLLSLPCYKYYKTTSKYESYIGISFPLLMILLWGHGKKSHWMIVSTPPTSC
jgi:hypothetical protein